MPQHLEQVNIDALDILDTLSSWLDNIKKDDYVLANADPILEKCIAKDLGKEIIPLWSKAVPKLYAIVGELYLYLIRWTDCVPVHPQALGDLPINGNGKSRNFKRSIHYSYSDT